MKKYILILFYLFISIHVYALPDFGKVIGFSAPLQVSILRDSEDKHNFFLFPQRFSVSRDGKKKLMFFAQKYFDQNHELKGYVEITFTPYFDREAILQAIKEIKKADAKAHFSFVLTSTSKLELPKLLFPGIENLDCQNLGGFLGQDITCRIQINSTGVNLFFQRIQNNFMVLFNDVYSFKAISSGEIIDIIHSIPMYTVKIPSSYIFEPDGSCKDSADDDSQTELGITLEEVKSEINKLEITQKTLISSVIDIDKIIENVNKPKLFNDPLTKPWVFTEFCGSSGSCVDHRQIVIDQPKNEEFILFSKIKND